MRERQCKYFPALKYRKGKLNVSVFSLKYYDCVFLRLLDSTYDNSRANFGSPNFLLSNIV